MSSTVERLIRAGLRLLASAGLVLTLAMPALLSGHLWAGEGLGSEAAPFGATGGAGGTDADADHADESDLPAIESAPGPGPGFGLVLPLSPAPADALRRPPLHPPDPA